MVKNEIIKNKIIKSEIKKAVEKYREDEDLKYALDSIRESFINNCNYKEMYNLNQFVKIERDVSAVFFFHNETICYDYSTVAVEFDKKFENGLFNIKNKKNIIQEIINGLNENKLIGPHFWTVVKFKDKSIVLKIEDPNEIKNMMHINTESNICISITQLNDNMWDYSI